jgi:hypothetical protein
MNKAWKKKIGLIHKKLLKCIMVGKYVFLQTTIKGELLFVSMGFSHGGLVDRLKGVISFYEVAKAGLRFLYSF